MTNRTVKIYGYGFGSTPASIEVTLDGNVVYNGTITTTSDPVPTLPDMQLDTETVSICEFELPVTFAGTIPMVCEVTNGTVIFAQIMANYCPIPNPVYTAQEIQTLKDPNTTTAECISIITAHASPPLTAEEITTLETTPRNTWGEVLASHNARLYLNNSTNFALINGADDPRTNIAIDGVTQTPDYVQYPGQWWYRVNNGSTLTYDMVVDAGLE